ncbi:MAG: C1 family peptidase, partial [Alistipes sp.]|nr:C1 family peptidase [Alistipes sp.]
MKRFITLALALMTVGTLSAQQNKGGITEEMMQEIRMGQTNSQAEKAARNALALNSVSELATNADNLAMIDTHFSHRVRTKGITDQHQSGRCWLFTGLNVLRAKMIDDLDLPSLEFSQNYLFFYDQLEKSNLFLQGVIDTKHLPMDDRQVEWLFKNPLSDGGQFTGVSNLVMKYGVVPAEIMPENYQSNNTTQVGNLLKLKLREYGLVLRAQKDRRAPVALKTEMLKEIYSMLVRAYGVPPTEFEWTRHDKEGNPIETKTYTPRSFYQEYFGGIDLEKDFVMVMNDPSREYYKVYEIEYDRHVYDGDNWVYLNLPIEEVEKLAIASIKDNTAMYFSCDVGKYLLSKKGTLDIANFDYESLMGVEFPMNKEERIRTFASGSSHAMTLIAVDLDEQGNAKKWMVENSWGPSAGWKGNLIMTDEWFEEYMFRVVVDKKYIPAETLKLLEQKPIMLPSWDP